jgi:hypothetical protein
VNRAVKRLRGAVKTILLTLQRPPAPDAPLPIHPAELQGVMIRWPAVLEWGPSRTWAEPLFYGLRARVPLIVVKDIPQELAGAVVIHFCRGERAYPVVLNFSDYPNVFHLGEATSGKPHSLALEFKMQYRNGGYGVENIVPGGFVSDSILVDWYARGPRRTRSRRQFAYDVYGRFGLGFATEIRSRALTMLRGQSRVRFYGGDAKVSYREFLREIARARVCLDLPGNGPFCFRLVNYLAVGACVISPPHATRMPVPLIDRTHIIYTRPDMSDLVDLCEHYTRDDSAREAVMTAGHDYYRRHLHWRSLSDYYLRTMLDRLPA